MYKNHKFIKHLQHLKVWKIKSLSINKFKNSFLKLLVKNSFEFNQMSRLFGSDFENVK